MKNFFLIAVALGAAELSFSQIKITNTAMQKMYGGMGGIFMNYYIDFKSKKNVKIEIDSVKSIADASAIKFSFYQTDAGLYKISFSQPLKGPEKCKTCPQVIPKQYNLTKGVKVYYRIGDKKSFFAVRKFKQLPDFYAP
jgi:hypothetical protein